MSERIRLTAVLWREGNWYVFQCAELGVARQGRTEKAAWRNLKQAVLLYLADDETGKVRWPVELEQPRPGLKPWATIAKPAKGADEGRSHRIEANVEYPP